MPEVSEYKVQLDNYYGPLDLLLHLVKETEVDITAIALARACEQYISFLTAMERRDIDLATRSKDRKALQELMVAEGYTGDRQYNALYGHKQLYFVDTLRGRPVDVLIDQMEMSHRFEFAKRLASDSPTVPLAEMLLSKLQIARINRKDILDATEESWDRVLAVNLKGPFFLIQRVAREMLRLADLVNPVHIIQ